MSFAALLPVIIPPLYTSTTENNPGTGIVKPVITLTCDDDIGETDIVIENVTSGETFEWTGEIVTDDVLEIDCETGSVELNGYSSLSNIGNEFISLISGDNEINVSGFSGTLNFTYRPRYL